MFGKVNSIQAIAGASVKTIEVAIWKESELFIINFSVIPIFHPKKQNRHLCLSFCKEKLAYRPKQLKSWHCEIYLKLAFLSFFLFSKTRTISVVSEETKKKLDQMITQNKDLEELLSKTRSDHDSKVRTSTDFPLLIRWRANITFFQERTRSKRLETVK